MRVLCVMMGDRFTSVISKNATKSVVANSKIVLTWRAAVHTRVPVMAWPY